MQAQRRDALQAAKAAVRAYARDPSNAHAIEVDVAWRRVRALDRVTPWRTTAETVEGAGDEIAPDRRDH
jgi:hypothetical protein